MRSQSYSCWYWVLSITQEIDSLFNGCLNPILAGTGFCQMDNFVIFVINGSLNPILAGTGFCQVAKELTFRFAQVSILLLLVLGSVIDEYAVITSTPPCLNPILAGTGFCPRKNDQIL